MDAHDYKVYRLVALLVFIFLVLCVGGLTYGSYTEQAYRMKCMDMRGEYVPSPGSSDAYICTFK